MRDWWLLLVVGWVIYTLWTQLLGARIERILSEKKKIRSLDLIRCNTLFNILRIRGPITRHGKRVVTPYFEFKVQFEDSQGSLRSKTLSFLEEILPQTTIDQLRVCDDLLDKFGIGFFNVNQDKYIILNNWLKNQIGDSISIIQDSTSPFVFEIINPLDQINKDNNDAEERRSDRGFIYFMLLLLLIALLIGTLKFY